MKKGKSRQNNFIVAILILWYTMAKNFETA